MFLPIPRDVRKRSGRLKVDEFVTILVPEVASKSDLFLASFLSAELADVYGIPLKIHRVRTIPKTDRFILIGAISNPLVRQYRAVHGINVRSDNPGAEGYVLDADKHAVAVLGSDEPGAFYGLQTLRQILDVSDEGLSVPAQQIADRPYKPFRGVYLFLPGRRHIPFFKRFVREVMALYKLNKLIVEVNAGMQFDRHPELNSGWIDFTKDMRYTRRERSGGPNGQFQDSANSDCADGGVLEKEEVAELVRYARRHYVDVIPEIATLTHSYYLLTRHRELAEIPSAEWPDTYCPSDPATYKLVFDVMDEYIEVMKPRMVQIGHDEWRIPWGLCPRCKGKEPTVLFAQDVNKIYSYLKRRNIEVAMWGDHLIERVRGKGFRHARSPGGYSYQMPGALSPQQVREMIPKDILIFNWFWNDTKRGRGEVNDIELQDLGFHQVYANMTPEIQNYGPRSQRERVLGGAPSSWAATTELNFGKDIMYDVLACSNLVGSTHRVEGKELSERIQLALPDVRRRVSMQLWPSDDDPISPVDIRDHLNAPAGESNVYGTDLSHLRSGKVRAGLKVFELVNAEENNGKNAVVVFSGRQTSKPQTTTAIPIGEDISSVLFLHASSQPAENVPAYRETWDCDDTADLLGYYHFTYDDGFVVTAPVRYGANILEAGWGTSHDLRNVALQADLVECGSQTTERMTFFAFEWVNPRFGRPLKEIRLEGVSGFKNFRHKTIADNSIVLLAVSVVKKRPASKHRTHKSPWSGADSTTSR